MRFIAGNQSATCILGGIVENMVVEPKLDFANHLVRSAFFNTFGALAFHTGPVLFQFESAVRSSNKVASRTFAQMMEAARTAGPRERKMRKPSAAVIPFGGECPA